MRKILLLSAWLTLFAHLTSFGNVQEQSPNIVLIYTDDQGYGDVSALNPDAKFNTPNIDRIADEGVVFTDGHSSDTVSSPSRYSILTGRYSWRTDLKKGVLGADGDCLIEEGRITLASLLQNHGYNTGMVGKWHLNMQFPGKKGDRNWSVPISDGPTEKGFDYYFGIPSSMNFGLCTYIENNRVLEIPSLWTRRKKRDKPYFDYRIYLPYDSLPKSADDIEVAPSFKDVKVLGDLTEKAVAYIDNHAGKAREGKPFFLYFALTSPHLPHAVSSRFQGKSNCGDYGDFMVETDFRVGQILDALKANGLSKNTLVIFTSDNGPETNYHYQEEAFGHECSYHFKGGKRDIYEGGHRVPFLMRWPNIIEEGRKVNQPVCQTDLLATFADIIGEELPDDAGEDSYSLLPAMKSDQFNLPLRGAVIHHSSAGYFAIRKGKWKLNMLRGSGGSLSPKLIEPEKGDPPFELYNIENDPRETTNLYSQHPDVVKQLKALISQYIRTGRSTPGEPQDFVVGKWPQLTWMDLYD